MLGSLLAILRSGDTQKEIVGIEPAPKFPGIAGSKHSRIPTSGR